MNERYEHIRNHSISILKELQECADGIEEVFNKLNGFETDKAILYTQQHIKCNLSAAIVTLMDISATLALICDKMADSKNYG